MKKKLIVLLPVIFLASCRYFSPRNKNSEKYKAEIIQTEKDFEKMAADSGLPAAFSYFVADSGVVSARDSLFRGKAAVKKFYQGRSARDVSLQWSPDFVDVSLSGDLGYTYGKYTFSFRDATGTLSHNHGIFHTVWKMQPDGSWKFVWD